MPEEKKPSHLPESSKEEEGETLQEQKEKGPRNRSIRLKGKQNRADMRIKHNTMEGEEGSSLDLEISEG